MHAGMLILIFISTAAAQSFQSDVRPILQKQCQGCHQPSVKQGNLDLTTYAALRKGGNRGAAIPLLIDYVTGKRQPRMPLGGQPLADDQIALLRKWIDAGAKDDTPAESITSSGPPVYRQPPLINALAYSPDGKLIAVSGYREVLLHKADGSGLAARLVGRSDRIQSILFSKDGQTLIAAGGTAAQFGEVQIWDVAAGKLLRTVDVSNDTVFGASLSPDGAKMAVGCTDNSLRVIDIVAGKEVQKIPHHENWVMATVFGVNGKRLVSVGRDRAAKLTDATNGQFIENVNLLRGELAAVVRHPTRDFVVVGGDERVPRVMKIADDTTLIRKLELQNGAILALAFSADARRIAVAGAADEVRIYDPETGERKAALRGHKAGIYSVAFSPDSRQVATGGFDGSVRIYDAESGALKTEFLPVTLERRASR